MLHPMTIEEMEQRKLSSVGPNSYKFCTDPIAKGKVNFPDSIVGRAKSNFDMYSGYVNISSAPDYLFYWLFENQV